MNFYKSWLVGVWFEKWRFLKFILFWRRLLMKLLEVDFMSLLDVDYFYTIVSNLL